MCPNMVANNSSTPQHLVSLMHTYPSYGLWELSTNFGVVFSMHEWVMTVGIWGCRFFSDLAVSACIF